MSKKSKAPQPHLALKEFCSERGTQARLAREMGVAPSWITALLQGARPTLRQAVDLERIAKIPCSHWVDAA